MTQGRKLVRVAFIGWGAINSRVGELLAERRANVEIVGIATIDTPEARGKIPPDIPFIGAREQLAALKPELVVEAAGREAIEYWASTALQAKAALIVASTSAFGDDALFHRLAAEAQLHGTQLIITPGAVGGIDALKAGAILGLESVLHRIIKPPRAWKGTRAEKAVNLDLLTQRVVFFAGTAKEAAFHYPQNANATIVTSLAGLGIDRTDVELVADPAVDLNQHQIIARGEFGEIEIALRNRPLATNPKSSELTALSLVRLIEQRTQNVII